MSIINLSSLIGIQDYTYLPVSSKIAVLFLRFLLIKYPFGYTVSWLYQIEHETKKSEDWEFKFHMNLCGRDCSGEWSQRPQLKSRRKRKHLLQVRDDTVICKQFSLDHAKSSIHWIVSYLFSLHLDSVLPYLLFSFQNIWYQLRLHFWLFLQCASFRYVLNFKI